MSVKDRLSNDNAFPGIAVLLGSSGKQLYQPKKAHKTVFRVFPVPDDKSFLSYRNSADVDDFSDWMYVDYVARYVGSEQRITFIPRCIDQDPKTSEMLWDRLVRIIFNGINSEEHPEWGYLARQKGGMGAPLTGTTMRQAKAKNHAFLQGVLLHHNGVSYYQQPKVNVVLMLPPSARMSLQELCNTEVPGYKGDPDDYSKRFQCGEWLDCATGKELVVQFKSNAGGDEAGEVNYDNAGSGNSQKPRGMQPNTYEVVLGNPSKIPPNMVNKLFKPWSNVIQYLNEQQQVELMCQAFKPDVVKAAFGNMGLLPKSLEFGQTISIPKTTPSVSKPPVETKVSTQVEHANFDGPNYDNAEEASPEVDDAPPFKANSDPKAAEALHDEYATALAEARKLSKK